MSKEFDRDRESGIAGDVHRRCRACGCTDLTPCLSASGIPCHDTLEEECLREIHFALTMREDALLRLIGKIREMQPACLSDVLRFCEHQKYTVCMSIVWVRGKLRPCAEKVVPSKSIAVVDPKGAPVTPKARRKSGRPASSPPGKPTAGKPRPRAARKRP